MSKTTVTAITSVLAIVMCSAALSATTSVTTNIERVYATPSDKWGGCMVRTESRYNKVNCNQNWLTLDCEGAVDGNTKSAGQRRFDVATLALLTGQRAKFRINDEIKINGYCYADRVELIASP